jgi:hypothetical protein
MWNRRFRQKKVSVDIGAVGTIPFLGRDVFDIFFARLVGCVADQNIDPAEFLNRMLNGMLAKLFIG